MLLAKNDLSLFYIINYTYDNLTLINESTNAKNGRLGHSKLLKLIVLHFQLNSLESTLNRHFNNFDLNAQVKSFLLFYFFVSRLPYINYKKTQKSITYNFAFKATLKSQASKTAYLITLYEENEKSYTGNFKSSCKSPIINTSIKGENFYSLTSLFETLYNEANLRSLNLKITGIINQPRSC